MNICWIPISRCWPPHRISHPEKVDKLAEALATGWGIGYPALVGYYLDQTCGCSCNCVQLLSGTHRLEAARRAGLLLVPVVVKSESEVLNAWGDLEKWARLMASGEPTVNYEMLSYRGY